MKTHIVEQNHTDCF